MKRNFVNNTLHKAVSTGKQAVLAVASVPFALYAIGVTELSWMYLKKHYGIQTLEELKELNDRLNREQVMTN